VALAGDDAGDFDGDRRSFDGRYAPNDASSDFVGDGDA
jgi:hypothetical protein